MPLDQPIRNTCPSCSAHPGERCTDDEGLMDTFHKSRLDVAYAYETQGYQRPPSDDWLGEFGVRERIARPSQQLAQAAE